MSCENCGAVKDAAARIRKDKRTHELKKLAIVCGAVVLSVACICGTILGIYSIKAQQQTIIEQQYALNGQYWELLEYVKGLTVTVEETTTATAEADGDGSISVAGDGNITAGGDVIGE